MNNDALAAVLQQIMTAAEIPAEQVQQAAAGATWLTLGANEGFTLPRQEAWVVQGSVQVVHEQTVLDLLVPGSRISEHARDYSLNATGNGCVVAVVQAPLAAPVAPRKRSVHVKAPILPRKPAPQPAANAFAHVRQRVGKRWLLLGVAALTLQALGLAQPIAAGFAIDEVLIFEHRHAWTLCLGVAGLAAILKYVLQMASHRVLLDLAPEDVVPRGVAYAAWLQGVGCWLGVVFVGYINPTLGGVMLIGLLAQGFILARAMPAQKMSAEANATHRIKRSHQLRQSLRHAESLVTQGLLADLAQEASGSAHGDTPMVAAGPRAATLVAWLSHMSVVIAAATLCQNGNLSLGMVVASILINLQAHHQARSLLAHAGEIMRPTRAPDDRRLFPPVDSAPLRGHLVHGQRLAVTGAQPQVCTQVARSVCVSEADSHIYIGLQSALPSGSLGSVVARHAHATTAQVLRALAWSGADVLCLQGLETPVVADDARLSALDKTRLHIAHALCVAPSLLVLDGVLDACGISLANALLVNLGRALPNTAVVLFTQRTDLAALCHRHAVLNEAESA